MSDKNGTTERTPTEQIIHSVSMAQKYLDTAVSLLNDGGKSELTPPLLQALMALTSFDRGALTNSQSATKRTRVQD